jgi:hypothetical protein
VTVPAWGSRTSETAWLFLQLVIRLLKEGGRCGIVVPNGILFGGGVGARIKQQLLRDCNLHTVVRLPDGVFDRTRRSRRTSSSPGTPATDEPSRQTVGPQRAVRDPPRSSAAES